MAISVIPALKGNVYAHADDTVTMVGEGTEEKPYQISTYSQLKKFANIVNGKNGETKQSDAWAVLTTDITCDDNYWDPIGYYNYNDNTVEVCYTGTFDGNGHKIKNLSNVDITGAINKGEQGLFGIIGNGGLVKNLGLENGSIFGSGRVGSIAGWNYGTITNCYNTGSVSGPREVGGIVENNYSEVKACYNAGVITGYQTGSNNGYIGGIAGVNAGEQSGTVTITNCFNTGRVHGSSYVGGVAGTNYKEKGTATIANCYNIGEISGTNDIGGVVGNNFANDSGLATITNCFNTGKVNGASIIGGIVGENGAGSGGTVNVTITNCYNVGEVSGPDDNTGGVVGRNYVYGGTAKVAYCYYDSSKSIVSKAVGYNNGTVDSDNVPTGGLTTARMTGEDAFKTGNMVFSFEQNEKNPWLLKANDEYRYLYPVLNGVGVKEITNVSDVISEDVITKNDWPAQRLKLENAEGTLGTAGNTYKISDYTMLKEFSNLVNGYNGYTARPDACAELVNDIVCTNRKWVPIGNYDGTNNLYYSGTFDGKYKKIIGLSNADISDIETKNYQGLFGFIGSNEKIIRYLGLENTYILGNEYVGSIAGQSCGSISRCYNVGEVHGEGAYVGGLIGNCTMANSHCGLIAFCYCIGKVSGTQLVGGIAGSYSNTQMANSYYVGDISAQSQFGGIVGYKQNDSYDCYIINSFSAGAAPVGDGTVSDADKVKELTVKQMTGTTAISTENMAFSTDYWLVKEDAEYNGKYYWFYPHLKGFDKDASGNQIDPADIAADKWLGKAEISVTWDGADSYEYDKSAHVTDVTKVVLKTDSTANGKEAEYTDYTASYSKITTDENGNPVWTDNIKASDIVNVGKYKTVLDFGAGHKAIEKQYSITEKAVTDTPDDVTKVYGTTDPELTYTASGLNYREC